MPRVACLSSFQRVSCFVSDDSRASGHEMGALAAWRRRKHTAVANCRSECWRHERAWGREGPAVHVDRIPQRMVQLDCHQRRNARALHMANGSFPGRFRGTLAL